MTKETANDYQSLRKKLPALELAPFMSDVVGGKETCVVLFMAPWCAGVHRVAPELHKVLPQIEGHAKVLLADVDSRAASIIGGGLNVRQIPTALVFREGDVVSQEIIGGLKADEIQELILGALEKPQPPKKACRKRKSLQPENK